PGAAGGRPCPGGGEPGAAPPQGRWSRGVRPHPPAGEWRGGAAGRARGPPRVHRRRDAGGGAAGGRGGGTGWRLRARARGRPGRRARRYRPQPAHGGRGGMNGADAGSGEMVAPRAAEGGKVALYAGLVGGVVALDAVTKYIVQQTLVLYHPVPVLGDFFRLTYIYN